MRLLSAFISLTLLLPSSLFAEGSCTWQDLAPLLSQVPQLRDHLTQTLDIEQTGIAGRLGSQYQNLSGTRVAPYRFRVKPKGAEGAYQFELVINASVALFDSDGNRLEDDDFTSASSHRELFAGATYRLLQAGEVTGTSTTMTTPPTTTEPAGDDPRVLKIRELFNEINMGDHRIYAIPFENPDLPMEAKVVFHQNADSGNVEYITVDGSMGDHSGISESFYFLNGQLIFVFQQDSHWSFHPQDPSQTIDTVTEKRYYFEKGALFQATVKKYEGGGPEKLQEASQKAEKQPLEVEGPEAMQLVSRASLLLLARSPEEVSKIYGQAFAADE